MNPPELVSTLTPAILLQLQEEERHRLAQALMRGPGQILANALMEIEYSLPMLEKNPQLAVAGLSALRDELRDGLAQLKDYVAELQPPLLEEMGLGPGIQQYIQRFAERTGIRAQCRGCDELKQRYPGTVEMALFRIMQEALENVRLHADASSVRIEISSTSNQLRLVIQDNGHGFVMQRNPNPKHRQLGLIAMRDRAELLGGQLQLFSEPHRGVRVAVRIPYHGHVDLPDSPTGGQNESEQRTDHHESEPQDLVHVTGQRSKNGKSNPDLKSTRQKRKNQTGGKRGDR